MSRWFHFFGQWVRLENTKFFKRKSVNISANATLYNWVRPPKQGVLCIMSASASPHACRRAVVGEAGSSESIMDNCNSSFIQFHLAIAAHSCCLENHVFPPTFCRLTVGRALLRMYIYGYIYIYYNTYITHLFLRWNIKIWLFVWTSLLEFVNFEMSV